MSSLHTKWRPTTFSEVLGQSHVTQSLKQVVKDKRAKVFLFEGPSGIGKTTLARILANGFCDGDANASNIHEINGAMESGKDDMEREVKQAMFRALGKSPIKVIIVDECHRLSTPAWNVLLKPTEEPPSHVYWVFCSTDPAKIPKTILTRCLRYSLKPVPEKLLMELLQAVVEGEKFDVPDEILEAITEGSGGSPRQALVYLEACLYCEDAAGARATMRSAAESKEVRDLCQWLIKGQNQNWLSAMKIIKCLEGTEAEGIRIVVVNYLSAVLMGSKDNKRASALLGLLECFSTPYNSTDKFAPLLMSIGMAMGLDQ